MPVYQLYADVEFAWWIDGTCVPHFWGLEIQLPTLVSKYLPAFTLGSQHHWLPMNKYYRNSWLCMYNSYIGDGKFEKNIKHNYFHSVWLLSLSQAALGLHDQWLLDKLEVVNRMVICSERTRGQQFFGIFEGVHLYCILYVKRFHRKWVFRSNFMEISK